MPKLKIQFDKDKAVDVSDIDFNQPFNLSIKKTDATVGDGISVKQESEVIEFTDGKKTFKIWIE